MRYTDSPDICIYTKSHPYRDSAPHHSVAGWKNTQYQILCKGQTHDIYLLTTHGEGSTWVCTLFSSLPSQNTASTSEASAAAPI